MVDGVSRVNAGLASGVYDDGKKLSNAGQGSNVVPMAGKNVDTAKGTTVQTGNPYFAKLPDDYFMELKSGDRDDAIRMTNDVRTRLAMAYADVLRENPDALVGVELPPFPEVPTDCKKKDRLDTYLDALRNHEFMVTTLLNEAKEATIVEQVNVNTDMRAAETQDVVLATTNAELAAIYSLHAAMLDGLNSIANLIETETHRIITAVDSNGKNIIRAINKATNEIKECIVEDGAKTRADAFLNTLGLHQHMNYNTTWLGLKIDDQGKWTRDTVESEHRHTRRRVTKEHNITRQFIHEEHEATRDAAGIFRYDSPEVPVSPEDGGTRPWWMPFFGPPASVGAVPYGAPVTMPSSTGSPVTGPTGAPDGDVGSTGYMTPVGKDGETPTETEDEVPKENNFNPPNSGDIGTGVGEDPSKASVFKGIFRADK